MSAGKAEPPQSMPRRIAPMLALPARMPRDQSAYGFEYKWDGLRAICFHDGRSLRLQSRNLLDITRRYPELAALQQALTGRQVILDGEIVALDERGRVSFSAAQRRMHVESASAIASLVKTVPIIYMLFDVLHLDGKSTMSLRYARRREMLEAMELAGPSWQTPPAEIGQGSQMLQAAAEVALEGLIAKRLDSRYEPGRRSGAWLKIKLRQRQEFVIGGYLLGQAGLRGRLGSLLVGYYEPQRAWPGKLRYAGGVGTGFTQRSRRELEEMLGPLRRERSPFADPVPRRGAIWVQPKLVAEVEFQEWTPDGILRQPSFKGLRYDKAPAEVVRERQVSP